MEIIRFKSKNKSKKCQKDDVYYFRLSIKLLCAVIIMMIIIFSAKFSFYLKNKNSEIKKEYDAISWQQTQQQDDFLITPQKAAWIESEIAAGNMYSYARGEVPYLYVKDEQKVCYLTFDDGPSYLTFQILDILKENNIKATFFVTGKGVKEYPDVLQRIYKEGHSIGNHTMTHKYNHIYKDKGAFSAELLELKDLINQTIGVEYDNLIFRFPGGSFEKNKQKFKYVLIENGYQYIDWNCLTGDGEKTYPEPEYLIENFRESSQGKEDLVLLMHDSQIKQSTAEILPQIIQTLLDNGYTFRPILNYTP